MDAKRRNEECRNDTLNYLADRPGLKFPHDVISIGLKRQGHDYTLAEVEQALNFLSEFGLPLTEGGKEHPTVERTKAPLGSTNFYGITPHGTLYHERCCS